MIDNLTILLTHVLIIVVFLRIEKVPELDYEPDLDFRDKSKRAGKRRPGREETGQDGSSFSNSGGNSGGGQHGNYQ